MDEEEARALARKLATDEEYAELHQAIFALAPLLRGLEEACPAQRAGAEPLPPEAEQPGKARQEAQAPPGCWQAGSD